MSATIPIPQDEDRPEAYRGLQRRGLPASPLYAFLRWGSVIIFGAVLLALVITIASSSSQAFAHSGIKFLWTGTWDPSDGLYATGTLVVGTVVTTIVAMVLVVPIGLGISTYLSEFAPSWLAVPLTTAIEFLAAIPSIVVGLWALLVLSPVFGSTVEPFLERLPVLGWFFHGPAYGPSIVLAVRRAGHHDPADSGCPQPLGIVVGPGRGSRGGPGARRHQMAGDPPERPPRGPFRHRRRRYAGHRTGTG